MWTKTITIWCDGAGGMHLSGRRGCNAWEFAQDAHSIAQARQYLSKMGWRSRGGRDYCPKHATEAN